MMNGKTLDNRRFIMALVHLVLVSISYILSFSLRFEFNIPSEYTSVLLATLPLLISIKMAFFLYFGLFSGMWRYVNFDELWILLKALSFSTIAFSAGIALLYGLRNFPRSIFILDWILSVIFFGGVRFLTRLYKEKFQIRSKSSKKTILIVGAGEAGVIVLKEYRNNPALNAHIAGFIDDDPNKRHLKLQGIKVLGNKTEIPDIVNQYQIEEIIIAIPSAKGEAIRDILRHCQTPNIKIRIVPGLHKIINGELEVKPREVKAEDLLGRETVVIDEQGVGSYIRDKQVLVTGAGGSIGSEICRQVARFNPAQIILLDHNENDVYFLEVEFRTKYPLVALELIIGDINDIGLLKYLFSRYKPQVVFHSAAYKHVPLMEDNPAAAIKNNVLGSRNLIYAAHHYKAERFILISTDKAVNPISVMGMTKRIAEMILQAKAKNSRTKFMAVRFGNVIGSSGSVVPLFKRQIEEGGPVTITHPEARRYFMSVREAVALVLEAGAIGKGGEIFILDMGEQIKIVDLANNLITLSGLKLDKDISFKFIGLRSGEKLSEEMLLSVEKDKVTKYDKIYVTEPNNFDPVKLRRKIRELERFAITMDRDKVMAKIKEIIF